jgi:hypothetical protein
MSDSQGFACLMAITILAIVLTAFLDGTLKGE